MRNWVLCAALLSLSSGCVRRPDVTSDQLPLRRVVVYRNGVGYFERSGEVESKTVTFKMKRQMVGDFLATLAIVERGGSTVRSASFPIEVEDEEAASPEPDPALRSMLKPWPNSQQPAEKPSDLREVVLHLDGKHHALAIGYVAETPVWRPSYRLVVGKEGKANLQAWGIIQNLSGEDWNEVELALIAGAPIAFQSTLGTPVIPQRPVVDDHGEVIMAVPGSVTSLAEMPEAEVAAAEAAEEEAEPYDEDDDGDERHLESKASPRRRAMSKKDGAGYGSGYGRAGGAAPRPAPAAQAPPPPSLREGLSGVRNLGALAAVAVESGNTRYELPTRITVPDQSATMVLLLSESVSGESLFLFSPDGGVHESRNHPFRVARFKNETAGLLERGPIAVFERGAFLGEGVMDPLPPTATTTVPFALERSLAVESSTRHDELGAQLHRVEASRLYVERDLAQKTTYKVKNGGSEQAKVLLKHPRHHGTRLHNPPAGTEENTGQGHALVPVVVPGHKTVETVVDERRAQVRQIDWMNDLADIAVGEFLTRNADHPLAAAWVVRTKLRTLATEERKLVDEQRELEKATRETRLSLESIEKNRQASDLRTRLTIRLKEFTDRLDAITKRLIELRMDRNEQQVRFDDAIRGVIIRPAKEAS